MKNAFFLIAFALGMTLAVTTYLIGGVFLMATGLSFSIVFFGCIFVMTSQVQQLLTSDDNAHGEIALPA